MKKYGIVAILVVLLLTAILAEAQGSPAQIIVCRLPRPDILQIEFRNIPHDWFVNGGTSWGYEAGAVGMDTLNNILFTNALEEDQDGFKKGTATIYSGLPISYGHFAFQLTGDANTPACQTADPTITPTPTPHPTAGAPVAAEGSECQAVWTYPYNYCYSPRPDGRIPIPPPVTIK